MSFEESLSLVIPCYNEEVRFLEQIPLILKFLDKFENKELILVNDGSSDNTLNLFKEIRREYSFVKIVTYNKNLGKGAAIRRGVLASSKDYILISDIDLSTPLKDYFKLNKYKDEYDVIIGSRGLENSNVLISQNFFKVIFGRWGNFSIRLLLGLDLKDTQCGFKFFNSRIKQVFKISLIDGFGYDFEILFLANKKGLKIKEVPVTWINDERSKVKFKHYFLTLLELFKVRINYFRKRY